MQVDNTRAWQNPLNHLDSTRDGLVTTRDVLVGINDLNANGSREFVATDYSGPRRATIYQSRYADDDEELLELLARDLANPMLKRCLSGFFCE